MAEKGLPIYGQLGRFPGLSWITPHFPPSSRAQGGQVRIVYSNLFSNEVIHQVRTNLPLSSFEEFRQLVGHNCSYLLPMQGGGEFLS